MPTIDTAAASGGRLVYNRTSHRKEYPTCPDGQYLILEKQFGATRRFIRVYVGCMRWTCQACIPRKRAALHARVKESTASGTWFFLTLTLRKNELSTELNWKRLAKDWDILLKRLKRQFKTVKYFKVIELTAAGMPHIHALIDCYLPRDEIERIWREITQSSYIAAFEEIRTSAAAYMFPYLTKSIESIQRIRNLTGTKTKIYTSSRGFLKKKEKNGEWTMHYRGYTSEECDLYMDILKKQYADRAKRKSPITISYDKFDTIEELKFIDMNLYVELCLQGDLKESG